MQVDYRIKTIGKLLIELCVIWYGMGMPIPTNTTDAIKLLVSIIVVGYTGYSNHDFTEEGCVGTGLTRALKEAKESTEKLPQENLDKED